MYSIFSVSVSVHPDSWLKKKKKKKEEEEEEEDSDLYMFTILKCSLERELRNILVTGKLGNRIPEEHKLVVWLEEPRLLVSFDSDHF